MVPDASKYSASIEPMQPSVQYGSSISAIVVPYLPLPTPSRPSFSHSARPHPYWSPTWPIVCTRL